MARKALITIAICLLASFASGANAQTRYVYINDDATLHERATTLRAVNELTSMGYPTRITENAHEATAILYFSRVPQVDIRPHVMGSAVPALGTAKGMAAVYMDRHLNYDLCNRIGHELGHAVWDLPHTRSGMMAAQASPHDRCQGLPRVAAAR